MSNGAGGGAPAAWLMRDTSWSRVGVALALGLLLATPLIRRGADRTLLLVYLQLPAYMLHQYEEHGHGAFKREMNALVPPSVGRLTDSNIFYSNVLGVWGVDLTAIALAATGVPAAGLLPPYLALVNGLLHLATALRGRRYNPGLGTALVVFLPFSAYSIRVIGRADRASRRAHVGSVTAAIVLHLLVVLSVVRARRDARQ